MKVLSALLVLVFAVACEPKNNEPEKVIQGEWEAQYVADGNPFVVLARFKPNGVVDVMANGKLIVSQQYRTTTDSIIFSGDPNCASGSEGVYKLTYFQDSVRVNIITDSCEVRVMNTDKVAFGRVQKK
jgi:hypothetical protein